MLTFVITDIELVMTMTRTVVNSPAKSRTENNDQDPNVNRDGADKTSCSLKNASQLNMYNKPRNMQFQIVQQNHPI